MSFKPLYRTALIKESTFEGNHAGRQGSAVYIKGLNGFVMEGATLRGNKAVDVLQEIAVFPPYARYFYNAANGTLPNYRSFSLMISEGEKASCGATEIEYLARCANSSTNIPQSVLQGAVYIAGGGSMHCDAINCGLERAEIKESVFTANEINYQY